MSDIETPGQDDKFYGWRARWTSRRRKHFLVIVLTKMRDWDKRLTDLHEPILVLAKPGRRVVEVTGQIEIDRPVMLARGMKAAMICDAHFAREWGDEASARRYDLEALRWHRVEKVRMAALAVQRVAGRQMKKEVIPGTMKIAPATWKGTVSE